MMRNDTRRRVKALLKMVQWLPVHPQWLLLRTQQAHLREMAELADGVVLDVGCSGQELRSRLKPGITYVGLDYYETAHDWYRTKPMVYGDAHNLPVADAAVDTVVLLSVAEHLLDVEQCFREISRVMRKGGLCMITVPFLYPEHDTPRDFRRWTGTGMQRLATAHGFRVTHQRRRGTTLSSGCLLLNLGMVEIVSRWAEKNRWLALSGLLFLPFVLILNLLGFGSDVLQRDTMGYHSLHISLQK